MCANESTAPAGTEGFAPPVQEPRIPIWVAATYPAKKPMRRAARWDGACLYKHQTHYMMPDDIQLLRDYVQRERSTLEGYDIAVGGKTPLSAGLMMAYEVMKRESITHPDVMPMMILLTDGAGNVSLTNLPPQEEAHRIAMMIKEAGIRSVVINMEHAAFDQGLAQLLANYLDGPCHSLSDLRADTLYQTVLQELD